MKLTSVFDDKINDWTTTLRHSSATLSHLLDDFLGNDNLIWRESAEGYTLELPIPGFKKEELNVKLLNDRLIVSAKNKRGNYYREISILGDVDKGSAKLEDGVLYINLIKSEVAKGKEIQIE